MVAIILCHIFFILSNFLSTKCSPTPLVPALYVFGDSLLDNGNNNELPTLAKANFYPYGINFPGGHPTGRFTNGKNLVDFISDFLGLPYPPPRASSSRTNSYTGYNYASGSCGILPDTGKLLGECLSLDQQMIMFQQTLAEELVLKFNTSTQLSEHLAKSFFVFSTGNNDYIINYFNILLGTSKQYNPQQFAQLLIDTLSLRLQTLYKLGARKIMVYELGPLGCIPFFAKTTAKPNGSCNDEKNKIVSLYNAQLALLLKNLTSTLQDSHFILGQVHQLTYDAIINPTKYGLVGSSNPCCNTLWNSTTCIPEQAPCANPNKRYFWDAFHPSMTVYSVVASRCIYGSDVCLPVNLQQLVQL